MEILRFEVFAALALLVWIVVGSGGDFRWLRRRTDLEDQLRQP